MKIGKAISVAVVLMMIGMFVCSARAYTYDFSLRVPLNEDREREKELLRASQLREIVLKEIKEKGLPVSIYEGNTNVYFDKVREWDFVIKQVGKKTLEFTNREKIGKAVPDAFIPWLIVDTKKQLWIEERTKAISIFLDECESLFLADKRKEAEYKVKKLADIWAARYLYLIQRGVKCHEENTLQLSDFGRSLVTEKWGFFDLGALVISDTPSDNKDRHSEMRFVLNLAHPLAVVESDIRSEYPEDFVDWWKEAPGYSKLAEQLDYLGQGWKEVWNIKPAENRLPQFRSKYLESLLPSESKSASKATLGSNISLKGVLVNSKVTNVNL